ncbi:sporulation histidine kinase inhibitor Sda [Halobacillus sp. GSS1]|nr:sporulation histidine kinase inhibitor Sda [Halobacillus sp. GSS1]
MEKLSSLLLKDTLQKALDLKLEDEFICLLKEEITKREKLKKLKNNI